MSGFEDAYLVDESDASVTSFADSLVYDSGADTDTDISIVSSMSSKRKPDLKNELYLFHEIEATKENVESLKTKLFYSNEVELNNILDLTKPRPNIDQEIMSQISEIGEILRNEKLPGYLKTSAETAKEKTAWAAECAEKEGTTVKRPIEILRSTLDVFLTACNKACEEHKLKSEAHNEFLKYKEYQEKIKKCVSDVSERNAYVERGHEHLATCIELAKADIEDIVGMAARETKEGRLSNFQETKTEIQNMTQSEMHDVKQWLKNCSGDLKILEELLNNQDERLPYVKKMHADDTENLNVKLQVNRDEQEDLKRQLQIKRDEEKKLRETLYQHKCQYEKFENLHKEFSETAQRLQEDVLCIQSSAETSSVVMKHIEDSSGELFDASIRAEREFLQMLKKLEIEAKERYLQALITSGVDKKIHIDYAVEKYNMCKAEVKSLKSKLQNAVKKGMQVLANDAKESLEKYEQELVAAKIEKEKLQQNLQNLTKEIATVSEELKSMGVEEQNTLESLYEQRKLEENEPDVEENMNSFE